MNGVRVTKRADVAAPLSELAQIERLAEQLHRLQKAVAARKQAALTKQAAPSFPAGRHPLRLVPDITSLTFSIFYSETVVVMAEEDEQG